MGSASIKTALRLAASIFVLAAFNTSLYWLLHRTSDLGTLVVPALLLSVPVIVINLGERIPCSGGIRAVVGAATFATSGALIYQQDFPSPAFHPRLPFIALVNLSYIVAAIVAGAIWLYWTRNRRRIASTSSVLSLPYVSVEYRRVLFIPALLAGLIGVLLGLMTGIAGAFMELNMYNEPAPSTFLLGFAVITGGVLLYLTSKGWVVRRLSSYRQASTSSTTMALVAPIVFFLGNSAALSGGYLMTPQIFQSLDGFESNFILFGSGLVLIATSAVVLADIRSMLATVVTARRMKNHLTKKLPSESEA